MVDFEKSVVFEGTVGKAIFDIGGERNNFWPKVTQ